MAARGRERMAKPAVPRARPTHAHSVAAGHRCQLSPALSHILVLCLLFSDKEDIQPVNSHKTRLEAGRRQSVAATSVGSRPCSLASSSQARPHPFPRTPPARTPPPWPWDGTWPPHATPRHPCLPRAGHMAWCHQPTRPGSCTQASVPVLPTFLAPFGDVGVGLSLQPRPCPAAAVPGVQGSSNASRARRIPACFYFNRCLKNKKEKQFCCIYTSREPKSPASAGVRPHRRAGSGGPREVSPQRGGVNPT